MSSEDSPKQPGTPGAGRDDLVKDMFDRREAHEKPSILNGGEGPGESRRMPIPPAGTVRLNGSEKLLPLAVDAGAGGVKFVQLVLAGGRPVIAWIGSESGSRASQGEALSRALHSMRDLGLRPEQVLSLANMEAVDVSRFSLPAMPAKEIEGAVKWELEQREDAGQGPWVNDYLVLGEDARNEQHETEVLLVKCRKQDVLEDMELMRSFKLETVAVEIAPLAASAALLKAGLVREKEVTLVLDLGASAVRFDVIADGQLQFTKELGVGGEVLTEAIRAYLQVDPETAEGMKRQYGLISDNPEQEARLAEPDRQAAVAVKNAIWPLLDKLVRNIDRTFKYFSYQVTKSRYKNFDRALLIGGMASLPGLDTFLESRLKVPAEVVNAFHGFEFSEQAAGRHDGLLEQASCFTTVLGLALRSVEENA